MADKNNNRGGFEPWDVLKRQHPNLSLDLTRLEILASLDPKQAEIIWNTLAEKNNLPKGIFPQLLQALSQNESIENPSNTEENKKEAKEEQKSTHSQVAHLPPSSTVGTEQLTDKQEQKPEEIPLADIRIAQNKTRTNPLKKYSPSYRVYGALQNKKGQKPLSSAQSGQPQITTLKPKPENEPISKEESAKTPRQSASQPQQKPVAKSVIPEYIKVQSPLVYGYRKLRNKRREEKKQIPQAQPSTGSAHPVEKPQTKALDWIKSTSPVFIAAKKVQQTRQNQNAQQAQSGGQGGYPPRGGRRNIINSINNFSRNSLNNYKRGRLLGQLLARPATAAATNPYVWVTIAVVAVILLFIFIIIVVISGGGNIEQELVDTNVTCPTPQVKSVNPLPGVTLSLNGPDSVQSGEDITYSLSVLYDESAATTPRNRIIVYDRIPENTTFVSATRKNEYDSRLNAVLWRLGENLENSFNLTIRPILTNICIVNIFSATSSIDSIRERNDSSETTQPTDYQTAIKSNFGIQMDGFTEDSLKWAYNTLNAVSNTKFIDLQRGHIKRIYAKQYSPGDWSSNSAAGGVNCPRTIELVEGWPAPDAEEIFKITLIHEISHVIDKCAPESESFGRYSQGIDGFPEVYKKEGGATYYGQHANGVPDPSSISGPNMTPDSKCPSGNPLSEDYADMLAYYLNPNSRQKNVCQNPERLPNPYENGAHPLHKALAEKILKN